MAKRKTDMKSKLKSLQKDWKGAEPKRGSQPLPDDNYIVRIVDAVVEEAKSSQRLQIRWNMNVIDGEFSNKKLVKFDGLEDSDNLDWLQGSLEALELDIPDNLEDIGEVLEDAAGLAVDVTVRNKDEYSNVYFNELAEGYDDASADGGTDGGDDVLAQAVEDEAKESVFEDLEDDIVARAKEVDIDPDKFETWAEAGAAVIEAEAGDEWTEDDINDMKKSELLTTIEDETLDIEDADDMSAKELRKAVIKELL